MISQLVWKKQLSKSDSLYSLCVNSKYSEVIVACQNEIIFIKLESGEIIYRRRYHRSIIYSVRISSDELYFASSSADGMIIVWQSKDHESLLSFGSSLAVRSLLWSPTETTLIALSIHEYHIWQPMQARARCIQINDLSVTIENGAFSLDGLRYALSFSDGSVKIYRLNNQEVICLFSFSSILTVIKFIKFHGEELLISVDIDRYVSIHKISDKSLIRKNELPFEALQISELNIDKSNFVLFSGIANKISIFTDNLMFLGNIQCDEKWIWDFQIDSKKNLLICGRNGLVEMRTLSIPSFSSSNANFIIFIENLNRFCLKNISNDQYSFSLDFPQIIYSLSISAHHLLVMFQTSIYVYLYNFQDNIEADNDLYMKMFEIPGNFIGAKSDISDRNIFVGYDKSLVIYSMSGVLKTNYNFHSKVNCVLKTEAIKDGCIIGCENGSVFFFIVDQPEPILLFKHKKAIKYAKKWNLTLAFIDNDNDLFVLNSFTDEILLHEKNIESFVFSDRVENLFAYNDLNSNLYVNFLYHKSSPYYIEGKPISFFENKVILINGNLVQYCTPELPFEQILRDSKLHQNDINKFYELVNINPSIEQWKSIFRCACELDIPDVALLAAQHTGEISFDFQSSQKVLYDQIRIEKYKNPKELEELGIIDAAIRGYAAINDWKNVYRLVENNGYERLLLDLAIPENECDDAAKYLLNSRLYKGAIELFKKSKNIAALANLYVFMGRWLDAIEFSLPNPSINYIIYPKFGEQLFEHKNYFESLICFFIPTVSFDANDRAELFSKLYNSVSINKDSAIQKSFICLLQAFNEPDNYWILHLKSVAFYASNRLSQFLLMPMNEDEVVTVFHLSYFLIAFLHRFEMGGIQYVDILTQFLLSATILGLKNCVDFALEELSSFSLSESVKQLVQDAETNVCHSKSTQKVQFLCPKCKNDIFSTAKVPHLHCGACGSSIAFSTHSCKPISIVEVNFDLLEKNDRSENGGYKAIEVLNRGPKCADEDDDFRFDEFVSKVDRLTVDDFERLPHCHCVVQELKEAARVRKRLWVSEGVECVLCCCNCGAFYSEVDYQDSVVGGGRCAICHSPIVDVDEGFAHGTRIREEDAAMLSLLRHFEEDSPVRF